MIRLPFVLFFAALLFSAGVYGVLARRNAVMVLMAIELMLNAVNVNLVAFGWNDPATVIGVAHTDTLAVGTSLFRSYVLPFEAISFLLLAALIGAIVLARKDDAR